MISGHPRGPGPGLAVLGAVAPLGFPRARGLIGGPGGEEKQSNHRFHIQCFVDVDDENKSGRGRSRAYSSVHANELFQGTLRYFVSKGKAV